MTGLDLRVQNFLKNLLAFWGASTDDLGLWRQRLGTDSLIDSTDVTRQIGAPIRLHRLACGSVYSDRKERNNLPIQFWHKF